MTELPDAETVDSGDDQYHITFRDPDGFDDIQMPDWAEEEATDVSDGASVRVGRIGGSDKWKVQRVHVAADAVEDENQAREVAREIGERIEP